MTALRTQQRLAFNEGVLLLPVTDLPAEVRAKLGTDPGDFALTRPQGRSGSKLLDQDAADLVLRFKSPRTIVEAVVLFSRQRGADPEEVLDGAFPLLKGLVASGFLVATEMEASPPQASSSLASRWKLGDELLDGRVIEVLQVLEDTELYCLRRTGAETRVIKVERWRDGARRSPVRSHLGREAALLRHLDGHLAPRLFAEGELEGRFYLEMEHIAGRELEAEAERARVAGKAAVLELALRLASAYSELHGRGALHGDIHPRNLLIDRQGRPRLVDFGLGALANEPASTGPSVLGRGGIGFFHEPELARAYLAGTPPPPSTVLGEQHALAVMIYLLATGAYPRDYSLGREEMLRELADEPPLPFADRGVEPWPVLEAVLARALAKDPERRYGSSAAFAAALSRLAPPPGVASPKPAEKVVEALRAADLDGDWSTAPQLAPPLASINYGAAGVALGLLTLAQARGEGRPLALAAHWLRRAYRDLASDSGFYNAAIDITPEMVGSASPYHSPAGLHAVAALLARAKGDLGGQAVATAGFLATSGTGHNGLDLTLGKSATLLAAAILLDALPLELEDEERALRELGARFVTEIWCDLETRGPIAAGEIEYPGMAHGWAGFLYAALVWSEVSGGSPPRTAELRLRELAALARPRGRGLVWPWSLRESARGATMPGWCNGSCGYVFLWTLAHRLFGSLDFLELARGAAWDAVDAPDQATTLCCGLAGRGYAVLNLFRATGEMEWLGRAAGLLQRATARPAASGAHRHSLWKGDLGLAVLAADLMRPEEARMPFFEPLGYRGTV